MLVEAAFAASRSPGPLRAFYKRIKSRRGLQVAMVATARKMTVLCWHLVTKDQDYAFARPALSARKRRNLELAAGHASGINSSITVSKAWARSVTTSSGSPWATSAALKKVRAAPMSRGGETKTSMTWPC